MAEDAVDDAATRRASCRWRAAHATAWSTRSRSARPSSTTMSFRKRPLPARPLRLRDAVRLGGQDIVLVLVLVLLGGARARCGGPRSPREPRRARRPRAPWLEGDLRLAASRRLLVVLGAAVVGLDLDPAVGDRRRARRLARVVALEATRQRPVGRGCLELLRVLGVVWGHGVCRSGRDPLRSASRGPAPLGPSRPRGSALLAGPGSPGRRPRCIPHEPRS